MFYRLFAAAVVVFWLTMTGLLLRKELSPGDSSLRAVPVAHVARMMLQREQSSDLQLYNEKTPVGHLRIQPHVRREDGQRQIGATGWVQLALPGAERQRVTWTSELDLDAACQAQRAQATVSLREPTGFLVDLRIDFATLVLHYETHLGAQLLQSRELTLDQNGVRQWMRQQGFDPALLGSLPGAAVASLEVRAQQSSLALHGDKIETYLISAEQSGQTLFEAHVSQLGQILQVKTMLGYSALPEEMTP